MSATNFIDMCAVCKQGVSRETMTYQKGRVFHQQCFEKQGSSFPTIDSELAQLSARTRVELVQMKNLKVRSDAGDLATPRLKSAKKPKKKTIKKSRVKKILKSKSKTKKTKNVKSKKRTTKRRR